MQTVIPFGDIKAQKKWSTGLAVDVNNKSYWERKFIGVGDNYIIERKTELEGDVGDLVSFDLNVQLRGMPVVGDDRAEGTEEALRFFTDEVRIDQMRHPVNCGGRMTRKRTPHDMRKLGKNRLSDYWAKFIDEMIFIYMSGARGINEDFTTPVTWGGHAGNAIQAPDSDHILYGGTATSKATITATDIMSRKLIERANTHVSMIRSLNPDSTNMVPVSVEGEDRYVCVMSKYQEYDMRTNDVAGWLDIQKAAAAAEGKSNPIFKGGLGMVNNTILHCHQGVIRFSDYGAGVNLPASRALFLGRQAGAVAYGSSGGQRYEWQEEMKDYGNVPVVNSGIIMGVKKTRFNGRDFGAVALDTHAARP